jgi:hypothetical protein
MAITMGQGDACPVCPGKGCRDWKATNPKDRPIEEVCGVRDEIRGRVEELLGELGASP